MKRLALMLLVSLVPLGCAARGSDPAVVEHIPSPIEGSVGDTLRVATINMWGVVVPKLEIPVASNIDERFDALAERLAENRPGLDIVFIQEAWATRPRRRLLEHPGVARNFPYRVDAVRSPGGSGLVTLSRYPLEENPSFLRFAEQGCCAKILEGDCIGGKGVLAVRARIGRTSAWLGNTHLIACYPGAKRSETLCNEGDSNGEVRRSQTLEAMAHMRSLPGSDPLILAGDFNFTRKAIYYPLMESEGWVDHVELEPEADRIDYLWSRASPELEWKVRGDVEQIFTQPVAASSGEEIALSDHPALAATFCLVSRDDPGRCLPMGAPSAHR